MIQYSDFSGGMEARDHFTCASRSASKNEASSKSDENRGNFRISKLGKIAFIVIAALFIASNANAAMPKMLFKAVTKTVTKTAKMTIKTVDRIAKTAWKIVDIEDVDSDSVDSFSDSTE